MYSIHARTVTSSGLAGSITTITTTIVAPLLTTQQRSTSTVPPLQPPSPLTSTNIAAAAAAAAASTSLDQYKGQLLADRTEVAKVSAALGGGGSAKLVWFYRHGQSKANVVSAAARETDGIQGGEPGYPGPAVRAYAVDESLEVRAPLLLLQLLLPPVDLPWQHQSE
jgi:hypothetical protein